jgi:hypothetical protein
MLSDIGKDSIVEAHVRSILEFLAINVNDKKDN